MLMKEIINAKYILSIKKKQKRIMLNKLGTGEIVNTETTSN